MLCACPPCPRSRPPPRRARRDEGEAKYNGGDAGGGAGGDPRPEDEERLPLENEWTFWYNKKIDKKNRSISSEQYERDLEIVGDVSSVQDFWCFFNNIRPPSSMGDMCCVSIFKNGIKPMWEDPINAKVGAVAAARTRPLVRVADSLCSRARVRAPPLPLPLSFRAASG
jgi:hypothetical protein